MLFRSGAAAPALPFAWLKPLAAKLCAVRPPRRLKLVENLPLGEKRFLALVEVGGRQLLVGSTPTSISLIERLTDDPPTPPEPAATASAKPLPRAC